MLKSTCLSALALLFASAAFAQITWEPLNGPTAASDMKIVVVDQSGRIFLHHDEELISSADNGNSWISSADGIPAEERLAISEVLVLPTGKVLAQVYYTYYQYITATNSWSKDIQFSGSGDLSLDDQQRLWRVTNGNLYYSTDGGQTFNLALSGQQLEGSYNRMANHNDQHNLVAVTYANQGKLYHFKTDGTWYLVKESSETQYLGYNSFSGAAFMTDKGFNWRSIDGGLTWAAFTMPVNPNSTFSAKIKNLYYESATRILALTDWGMFLSENDGASWAPLQGVFQSAEDFFRTPNGTYFSSRACSDYDFQRSIDLGETWTDLSQFFYYPTVDNILVARNNVLYARNCYYRYELSIDGGQSWSPANITDGLPIQPYPVVVQPDGDLFSLSYTNYIIHSSDSGNHWEEVTQPVDPTTNVHYFTIQTDPYGNLYAFYEMIGLSYKSADKGQSWQAIQFPSYEFAIEPNFLFAPNGDIYYVDYSTVQHYLVDQDTSVLEYIKSTNGEYLTAYRPTFTAQGDLIFFDSYSNLYRYSSSQGAELLNFPGIHPTAIAAAQNGLTFVISNDSLYQSDNSGFQWTFVGKTPYGSSLLSFQVGNDQHLYLSYDQHTPYRSVLPLTTAVHEPIPGNSVQVFPNPFQDLLHFRVSGPTPRSGWTLLLMDAMGRVVQTARFAGGDGQLSRKNLPTGMYFYAVLGEHGQWLTAGRVMAD